MPAASTSISYLPREPAFVPIHTTETFSIFDMEVFKKTTESISQIKNE